MQRKAAEGNNRKPRIECRGWWTETPHPASPPGEGGWFCALEAIRYEVGRRPWTQTRQGMPGHRWHKAGQRSCLSVTFVFFAGEKADFVSDKTTLYRLVSHRPTSRLCLSMKMVCEDFGYASDGGFRRAEWGGGFQSPTSKLQKNSKVQHFAKTGNTNGKIPLTLPSPPMGARVRKLASPGRAKKPGGKRRANTPTWDIGALPTRNRKKGKFQPRHGMSGPTSGARGK